METIIIIGLFGLFNALSFYLGARLARGEKVLPPAQRLTIVPSDDDEEEGSLNRYGNIWPRDRLSDNEEL